MEYFAKLPLCSGWNQNLVKYIYLNSFSKKLTRRELVYDEDQEPDGIYIIKEGTFIVNKK
jgi:CRP-like cAMP-binding protein